MFEIMEFDGKRLVPNGTRELDQTKIDFHSVGHSSSSMLRRGVYPPGTTMEQVEDKVRGTFGGRFIHFGDGRFECVAYTD